MKKILGVVGMPGSGKSEAVEFFKKKGMPSFRFGDLTDQTLAKLGLERNEKNEKIVRENLRQEQGMDTYAVFAKPKIENLLLDQEIVVLDGLYSWEEYTYLIKEFEDIVLLAIYASPIIRYERLAKRSVRPLIKQEGRQRDIAEIEHLNKAGPIAIADYLIKNESTLETFYKELDEFFLKLRNDTL